MDQQTFDKIRQMVTRYTEKVAEIRADQNLSDLGRRNAIVAEYTKARTEVDRLRGDDVAADYARQKALKQRLFGLSGSASSSDVISFRDAQDRVEKVKSAQELGDLMERASSVGDRSLLQAGFGLAYERSSRLGSGGGWDAIVGEYVEQFPSAAGDLAEYRALTNSTSMTNAFAQKMQTTVPVPPEYRDRRVLSDEKPSRPAPLSGVRLEWDGRP